MILFLKFMYGLMSKFKVIIWNVTCFPRIHAALKNFEETKLNLKPRVLKLPTDIQRVCFWRNSPQWARASSFTRFLDHAQRRTTLGRSHLDEWSARRRNFYLTTHNTHNRETSMPPVGFEPTFSASERSQTYTSDRSATGTALCKG
jgi:hypothetical protein